MPSKATTPLGKSILRQSWSKYNLYNHSRVIDPLLRGKTFYQQKWISRSALRKYHGEPVRESHWCRMFRRRLRGVVPMNPEYLASNDGTIESAGRGSGLNLDNPTSKDRRSRKDEIQRTPFMQMTFAPLERRLDTAVFRALFASSTRQARQFVVHGAVKVNGQKMKYPGYLLNPGDMFQVDPELVMYATGAQKAVVAAPKESEDGEETEEKAKPEPEPVVEEVEEEPDIDRPPREILKDLQSRAKSILSSDRAQIGAKRKQDLRAFTKAVKRMLSRSASSTVLTDSLEAQFEELKNQLRIRRQNQAESKTSLPSAQAQKELDENPDAALAKAQLDVEEQYPDAPSKEAKDTSIEDGESQGTDKAEPPVVEEYNDLSEQDYGELFSAFQSSIDNPIDESKPYATPWRPRDYMSVFTFVPKYLEVNHNACAAVYLRHPVARPGSAEVPTPFPERVSATAYAWYLRRR